MKTQKHNYYMRKFHAESLDDEFGNGWGGGYDDPDMTLEEYEEASGFIHSTEAEWADMCNPNEGSK